MNNTVEYHDVPYVEKREVAILALDGSTEALAIRTMLEGLDYLVTIRWIGSRRELVKVLRGEIETAGTVVISGHGDEHGLLVPDEAPLGSAELADIGGLNGKTVVSTACLSGRPELTKAFRRAGVAHYIAPDDYPDFRAVLAFVTILFFLLADDVSIAEAAARASAFHGETSQFKLLV